MEVFLVAATAFVGAVALDGMIEIGAEIGANWNGQWASHYFWDIRPDSGGTESQRLAAELVARVPDSEGYRELCALPMLPQPSQAAAR